MKTFVYCVARMRLPFALLASVLFVSSICKADSILVDNLGFPFDSGQAVPQQNFAKANAFTPSIDGTLVSVTVNLSAYNGATSTVEIALWSDDSTGPKPLAKLESLGTVTFNNSNATNYTLNSTTHTPLTSGVRYWIAVHHRGGDFDWNLTATSGNSTPASGVIDLAFSFTVDRGVTWYPQFPGAYAKFSVVANSGATNVNPVVVNTNDSGDGSLRQALLDASIGGVITFDPSLSGETLNALSPLEIEKDVTIDGSELESGFTIFSFNSRKLTIVGSAELTMNSVNLSQGLDDIGGAIFNNSGKVTITNATVSGNAASEEGGGIWNGPGGTVVLVNSTISGNASPKGGAIYNEGALTLTNTIIEANDAAMGGGIWNSGNGTVTINGSTISNNNASSEGGGLWNNSSEELTIADSTLSGNSANTEGGGLYNGNSGTVTVTNSTVSGNSASTEGGGIWNSTGSLIVDNSTISNNTAINGGGIVSDTAITIHNTIVADNFATTNTDIAAAIAEANNNLIGVPASLAPLGNYGGPTQTMPPIPGSLAIDAGGTTILNTDQRGLDRIYNGTLDIGAVEYTPNNDLPLFWTLDTDNDGVPFGLEDTLYARNPIASDSSEENPFSLTIDPNNNQMQLKFTIKDNAALHTIWRVKKSGSLDPGDSTELFRFDGPSMIDYNNDPTNFSLNTNTLPGATVFTLTKFTNNSTTAIYKLSAEYVAPVEK